MSASPLDEPGPAPGRTSLLNWLRGRTDAELAELLRRRPDLALPAPADLHSLASRVGVRTSVQRAVDGLDSLLLRMLDAVVLSLSADGVTSAARAAALLTDAPSEPVEHALDELRALALVWGEPDELRVAPAVRESLGAYPGGLGRPALQLLRQVSDVHLVPVQRSLGLPQQAQPRAGVAIAEILGDRMRLNDLIAAVSPAEREVLDRLAAGPPVGTVRVRDPAGETPAIRLLDRGLLIPVDAQTVELPREVGLALRPSPLGRLETGPPRIAVVERAPADLDRLGTTAVLNALRLVDALADAWTANPPAQLRAGGVGVRELRRTAKELGAAEWVVALVAEVAAAAGLINATQSYESVYLPTEEFDAWRGRESAARWSELALAWLAMTRRPGLVGQRGERDRLITLLSPDVERGTIPALRGQTLELLNGLAPGSAPADTDEVLRALAWQTPRRAAGQRPLAAEMLREADQLGLTAAGGLTGYTRTLLSGSRTVAEQVLAAALPEPVDHFLVQPDLTVVVPGPPTPDLATELALAADLESTGGANVYRITEASVRRALDAGRSGIDIAALIAQRSRTPVPQSLRYLIDDLSRRHGLLRSGAAGAYLRCPDEALLARVLADRDTARLHLRRIAPTVVITSAPVAQVLDVLRAAGYAPAAEDPEGRVVALDAEPPRAPARNPVQAMRPRAAAPSAAQYVEVVRRMRSGDTLPQAARQVPPLAQRIPGVTSAATMGLLREAIRDERRVLLGVAEADGSTARHTLAPISMAGGVVRGTQEGSDRLAAFQLHRITAVTFLDEDD